MVGNDMYDIIIVGGGPAGLTAGMYACRGEMNTLLLEKAGAGGQILMAELVENYPGFHEGISGYELTDRMKKQAEKFGLDIRTEEVKNIVRKGREVTVITETREYKCLAVIIAAGAGMRKLGVPGEDELRGRGVSYCATCDGPFFRDKEIAVVGGGNSAVHEAVFLSKFGKSVKLIHRRSKLRAAKILQKTFFANEKTEFIKDSIVTGINGKDMVESVSLENVKTGQESKINCGGIFVAVGVIPNSKFLKGNVEIDEKGYIITDNDMKTSAEGIFACGDVRKKTMRQVINACGEGAQAVYSAQEYVEELKGTSYGKDFSV